MSKLLREHDSLMKSLITTAKKDRAYVVARLHRRDYYSALRRNHKLDQTEVSQDSGLGLYVFTMRGHVAFGSTNNLTTDSVQSLYKELLAAARTNEELGIGQAKEIYELKPQANLGEDALHYQHLSLLDYDLGALPPLMEKLEKFITDLNPAINVSIATDIEQDQWRIMRSDGTDVDFSVPKVRVRTAVLTLQTKAGSAQARLRYSAPSLDDLETQLVEAETSIRETVSDLERQITAKSVTPGSPAMILDAALVGMIAHEALGHPAESDLVISHNSVLGDSKGHFKKGQKIAAASVNVFDHEANLTHGFHPYGAFGNARKPVAIVKNGVLSESISDVFSANKTGVPNKNCERSEGYWAPAVPRMSNTYVEVTDHQPLGGDKSTTAAEQAQATLRANGTFKKHPSVLFIRQMTGGQVNPANGSFMFGTAFVDELTDKSITARKPVSFSGSVLAALTSISFAAGDVDTTDFGYCGKSSQTAHVTSGGNALVFLAPNAEVTVA